MENEIRNNPGGAPRMGAGGRTDPRGDSRGDARGGGRSDPRGGDQRGGRFGRRLPRVCPFCKNKVEHIDYKEAELLRRYLTERGKIKPRRKIGTCAHHQRRLTLALKRARHIALLPFTVTGRD